MTDYDREQSANRWAHKHRWHVWLAVPAAFFLFWLAITIAPITRYGITGILPQ